MTSTREGGGFNSNDSKGSTRGSSGKGGKSSGSGSNVGAGAKPPSVQKSPPKKGTINVKGLEADGKGGWSSGTSGAIADAKKAAAQKPTGAASLNKQKSTSNLKVYDDPLAGEDPYYTDPEAGDILKALENALGIMGGGVGMVSTVADMLSGNTSPMSLTSALGLDTSVADSSSTYSGRGFGKENTQGTKGDLTQHPAAVSTGGGGGGGGGTPTEPTTPSTPSLDSIYDQIKNATEISDLYYLQQRGLVPGTATSIPAEWQPIFDREFDRIKATVPSSATTRDQIGALFPTTFGNQALDAEQQRKQNVFKTGVGGLGLEGQVTGNFGDTSDDSIIDEIYNSQYNPASTQLMNALKRGALNPAGYNYGMNKLQEQGTAGRAKLQDAGAAQRSTLSGGLNDYITDIYDKAGSWQLGQPDFDPSSYTSEFGNRLSTAESGLRGNLMDQAPSIFDVSGVLSGAGSVQGMTNRGGLLDTLAGRSAQRRNTTRGIGSTGAF